MIRAELQLGYTENLGRLLSRLLQMRRPDPELLVEAYRKLGSDRFIFTPDRENLLLQLSAILREDTQTRDRFYRQGRIADCGILRPQAPSSVGETFTFTAIIRRSSTSVTLIVISSI